jgi:hypothetical protein
MAASIAPVAFIASICSVLMLVIVSDLGDDC